MFSLQFLTVLILHQWNSGFKGIASCNLEFQDILGQFLHKTLWKKLKIISVSMTIWLFPVNSLLDFFWSLYEMHFSNIWWYNSSVPLPIYICPNANPSTTAFRALLSAFLSAHLPSNLTFPLMLPSPCSFSFPVSSFLSLPFLSFYLSWRQPPQFQTIHIFPSNTLLSWSYLRPLYCNSCNLIQVIPALCLLFCMWLYKWPVPFP